jgi:hypothetical protein
MMKTELVKDVFCENHWREDGKIGPEKRLELSDY